MESYYERHKEELKAKARLRYQKNRDAVKARVAAYSKKTHAKRKAAHKNRIAKLRSYVNDYKLSHPCVMCGECDPVVLEFHHRDPSLKDETINRLQNDYSLDRLKEEIEKCDVVCANDHRRIYHQWRMKKADG